MTSRLNHPRAELREGLRQTRGAWGTLRRALVRHDDDNIAKALRELARAERSVCAALSKQIRKGRG